MKFNKKIWTGFMNATLYGAVSQFETLREAGLLNDRAFSWLTKKMQREFQETWKQMMEKSPDSPTNQKSRNG